MAISLVAVGQIITATLQNAIIAAVNAIAASSVTPTTVAGTGVSLSGAKVVASAATAVSVNGCFTSAYSVYDVMYNLTSSGSATMGMTLRLSGTDSTTGYDRVFSRGLNATNTVGTTLNAASWALDITSVTGRHVGKVRLFDPAIAAGTTALIESGTTASAAMTTADGGVYELMVFHRPATAYDGFTVTPTSGNVTGTIWIIGIA